MANKTDQNIILEDEKKILLDHDYDGIQELNNPLPTWWKMTFYGGILYAIGYFIYYQLLSGPTLKDEYLRELATVEEIRQAQSAQASEFNLEIFTNWQNNNDWKALGSTVFEEYCIACHMEKGQGDVGPNLTDSYWLYGDGTYPHLYNIVYHGNEENGMPIWSEMISQEEIFAVISYVVTLRNTQVEGKEPEGEKFDY